MDQSPLSILRAVPIPLVLIGADQRVIVFNTRAEALLGRGLEGRHFVSALRAPPVVGSIEQVFAGNASQADALLLAMDGTREVTWKVTAARVTLASGNGVLVSFEDTTAVQEAGQIRRDFVANVSHELRTPLTALLGFIETLRGAARNDAAARERFLGIMEREAGRMNRLVSDLLSLSRVEADERRRPTAQVDLSGLVASVIMTLRPMAHDASVALNLVEASAPLVVPGDADQLLQVFTNLVENAIKYGGRGASVTVSLTGPTPDAVLRGTAAVVAVADDGDGFDPVHIPRLTERFYRVDSHRSREKGGTGLGLAIVKHIVNRHRGRLNIESEPGKGSRFTVFLPLN